MARWRTVFSFSLSVLALAACSTGDDEATNGGAVDCVPGDARCTASSGGPGSSGAPPAPPAPTDGVKNGDETDIDCGGGGNAPRCEDGKGCGAASDCVSQVCKDARCQAPRGDDGVKNGDESDVDCGGTNADTPRCAAGKSCKAHGDCTSDGCGYDGKCALARSCAGHFGGDTCGSGEVGEPDAQHESCCASAPISGAADAMLLDKYVITAGRMRQFIERANGDLRAFGQSLQGNPSWTPDWNDMLPASVAEANFLLGPQGHGTLRRGCDLGDSRGRTYWMSAAENQALGETGTHPFTKDILDQKALNCVEFFMLQALCIWDGGRLATQSEIKTAWQAGEKRVYPWGNDWTPSKVVWQSNYQFPEIYDQGNFIYVAAPGRRPEGNGKFGHADLAGLVYEITSDVAGNRVTWAGNGTWEGHGVVKTGDSYGQTEIARAYWATGGRCARPH
jgi:Sulfatase-modifying factor enzyme 1